MKSKSLTTRILATILSVLVCFTGWVGLCLLVELPDLSAFVLIGIGVVIVGVIANIIIWRWGDKKGE